MAAGIRTTAAAQPGISLVEYAECAECDDRARVAWKVQLNQFETSIDSVLLLFNLSQHGTADDIAPSGPGRLLVEGPSVGTDDARA